MEIKEHTTKELVEELSKREGVERLETPVEGQDEITIEKDRHLSDLVTREISENYIYDGIQPGPAIILRIID